MTVTETHPADATTAGRVVRAAIWLPGLAVALGAAVATAHGLYEVAVAARVPAGLAWLYPLITDGLALVAYAATARLTGPGRRYAWAVVILAAGLSGIAQAAYLATDGAATAAGFVAPAGLRFGVGAWPAIAAAIVAHLLYLLATDDTGRTGASDRTAVQPYSGGSAEPSSNGHRHAAPAAGRPLDPAPSPFPSGEPFTPSVPVVAAPPVRALDAPARDKARAAARRHAAACGAWPTVTQLMTLAEVSRGTAGEALKHLRSQPEHPQNDTHTTDQETQP